MATVRGRLVGAVLRARVRVSQGCGVDDLGGGRGGVTAERVEVRTDVITREGHATAHAGDWVVTSEDGWSWPVRDAVFRASYELLKPD